MKKIIVLLVFVPVFAWGQAPRDSETMDHLMLLADELAAAYDIDSVCALHALVQLHGQAGNPRIRLVKTPGVRAHEIPMLHLLFIEYWGDTTGYFAELSHQYQWKYYPEKLIFGGGWQYGRAFACALFNKKQYADSTTFILRWQSEYTRRAYRKENGYELQAHGPIEAFLRQRFHALVIACEGRQ